MLASIRARRRQGAAPEIPLAPLIDMMFILLIFFVVSTRFQRETGLEVRRPESSTAQELDPSSVLVGIGAAGEVWVEDRPVGLEGLAGLLRRTFATRPDAPVVLIADRGVSVDRLVRVMDEARAAGAARIAIASRREGP